MIPSCGLHTSIDKRNFPSGMTLAKKPAEFREKGQRCLILIGKQLLTTFYIKSYKITFY